MPYISKEQVKIKRNLIKKSFPDYKFSIRGQHGSVLDVSIMSGPLDLNQTITGGHYQVNHYHIESNFKEYPEIIKLLQDIKEIGNNGNGIESVDGDYGNIPHFYFHLNIGKWDKDYVQIKK